MRKFTHEERSLVKSIVATLSIKRIPESVDQISFGHSNFGYRYFLSISSPSKLFNSSSGLNGSHFLSTIPAGYDVPFKGM